MPRAGDRWPRLLLGRAAASVFTATTFVRRLKKPASIRAEETRTVADQMTHEEARTIMRRIALDYDRLAKLAEEQLTDQERGAIGDKT